MNIIFDIGRVLSSFRWRECCEDLGFTAETVELFGSRLVNNPRWNGFDLSIEDPKVLIEKYAELFPDHKEEYKLFWENTDNMADQYDYSENWLKTLKNRGHKIYLLSNYPEFMFKSHSRKWGFLKYTDGRTVSFEHHIMKPDQRIYQLLIDRYSLDPSKCVFTDDRPENIEGAENVGIHGILFEGYEKTSAALDKYIDSIEKTNKNI